MPGAVTAGEADLGFSRLIKRVNIYRSLSLHQVLCYALHNYLIQCSLWLRKAGTYPESTLFPFPRSTGWVRRRMGEAVSLFRG